MMASEKEKKGKEWTASSAVNEFDEYLRQSDPERREKAVIWKTAVGLQAVDGLQASDFFHELAPKGGVVLCLCNGGGMRETARTGAT